MKRFLSCFLILLLLLGLALPAAAAGTEDGAGLRRQGERI